MCQNDVAGVIGHAAAPGTGLPCAIAAAAKAITSRGRLIRRTAATFRTLGGAGGPGIARKGWLVQASF